MTGNVSNARGGERAVSALKNLYESYGYSQYKME